MRLPLVILLAIIAFLSSVAASVNTTRKLIEGNAQKDIHTTRFLRTSKANDVEERAAPTSIISKLKQAASDYKTKSKMQSMLKKETSPDDAFKKFKLDEAGTNLLNHPKLKSWFAYKQLYDQNHGIKDSSGIETISKFFNDDELSAMVNQALNPKMDPVTRDMAEQIRVGQLDRWSDEGESVKYVFDKLGVQGSPPTSPARVWFREYRDMVYPRTERIQAQLDRWFHEGKSEQYVFDKLGVRGTPATSPARGWFRVYRDMLYPRAGLAQDVPR